MKNVDKEPKEHKELLTYLVKKINTLQSEFEVYKDQLHDSRIVVLEAENKLINTQLQDLKNSLKELEQFVEDMCR